MLTGSPNRSPPDGDGAQEASPSAELDSGGSCSPPKVAGRVSEPQLGASLDMASGKHGHTFAAWGELAAG
jgi:hypothetical protein